MKLKRFFEKFDQLADAPNAVEKLRELVLRMATSGRIADQDPSDQPASELFSEIFAIRDGLIKKGVARSRVEGKMIVAGDTIDIPASWSRCMISEVCDLQTGATPSRQESTYFGGDTPWLVSGDINKGEIFECDGRVTESGLKNSNCKIIPKNSVLIALNGQGKTRATVAILRIEAALNQSLVAMIPYSRERLLPEYLFWNLRGRYYSIRDITGQDQRRGLNMKLVGQLSLPIPPLAEQKRIVAKVDELMALCDRLEAQQQERDTRHAALARASLARFAEASTPANLDFLFHNAYTITPADLRKTILTLAVQGKLVPQEPNDEPADNLLSRIASAKLRLQKEGKIGKEKTVDSVESNDAPFDIPNSWRWAKLAELTELITKGSSPKWQGIAYVTEADGVLFITSENVGNYRLRKLDDLKYVDKRFNEIEPRSILKGGDILMNLVGASIGRTAIYDLHGGANINQAVALIRLVRETDGVCAEFLLHYLNSHYAIDSMLSSRVVTAQPNISLTDVREFTIPIPPLAEQRRIVARVDQLMALVDQLETQLTASRATAAKLMQAVVAELTASAPSSPADSSVAHRTKPGKRAHAH